MRPGTQKSGNAGGFVAGAMALTILLWGGATAAAEEPRGCDKFAWPIEVEQQALAGPDKQAAPGSVALDRAAPRAIAVALAPLAEAHLAMPPERAPKKPDSFAGAVEFGPGGAGTYKVTLSAGAWIDIVQDGKQLKSVAFSGALDCPNVRKSVKFAIGRGAFTLQLSDVVEKAINVVITPAN